MTTCPEQERDRHKQRPTLATIGRDGKPIRALAFAGGAFDTAMQLGVVHALLVSRARAPDIVIGCSAGAVNAVALAEVLQAGDIHQRVLRFRQIYDQYLKAPGVILGAGKPDTFQVDTQRPLEPLRLPIHHRLERDARLEAVASRAGIINLYNTLLSIRVSIGTMTKALRRWLGIQQAGNIQQPFVRKFIQTGEWLRTWMLLGANLPALAPLVRQLVDGAALTEPKVEHGATAGALIFRSRLWGALEQRIMELFGLLLLAAVWMFSSAVVTAVVGALPVFAFVAVSDAAFRYWQIAVASLAGATILSLAFGVVGERWPDEPFESLGDRVAFWGGVLIRTAPRALWGVAMFVLLMVLWGLVVLIGSSGAQLVYVAAILQPGGLTFRDLDWIDMVPFIVGVGLLVVSSVVAGVIVIRGRKQLGIGLLRLFNLDQSVFDPHALRQLLINLFDPHYYGPVVMDRVVESALRNQNDPSDDSRSEKYLEDYADQALSETEKPKPPIHVIVTVADVKTSDLDYLPGTYRVVDGLVAALAAPPLFPPQSHGRRLFVDAAVVANDPARPLFRFLRNGATAEPPLVNVNAAVLHLYSVSPLPLSTPQLGAEPDPRGKNPAREYSNLVDVVLRALALQRFRDAKLERTLSELHTKSMPQEGTVFYPEPPAKDEKRHVRTWVYPVEPERPLNVNARLLGVHDEATRREIMAETIADGCRATLSVMLREAVKKARSAGEADPKIKTVPCRRAVEQHFKHEKVPFQVLPGSAETGEDRGPGLAEVCAHCALFRDRKPQSKPRSLYYNPAQPDTPRWPIEGAHEDKWEEREHRHTSKLPDPTGEIEGWPQLRMIDGVRVEPSKRATVSFLFSGGVFRGVFQVGVLNALSEAGLVPDVVAGASVGSITAAMAASTFFGASTQAAMPTLAARQTATRRLAAAYLAIDRLVLTDRFADFVRGLTIRAAQARFSIRQADRVIRRFDDANAWRWSTDVRAVVAGIERLAYMSPFELVELLEAFRRQQPGLVGQLLRDDLQEFMDRAGVGTEVLGAEPLALLIREFVLEALAPGRSEGLDAMRFSELYKRGLIFLATATNLTDGRLEVLGEKQMSGSQGKDLSLPYALLASSAFPAVFRPRWEWELRPESGQWGQYIDGGVVDNLPFDAVAQVLNIAARRKIIMPRPPHPHLVFSASLETETEEIVDDRRLDALQRDWPQLLRRAKRLGYNKKNEMFWRTQRNVRAIIGARKREWEAKHQGQTAGPDFLDADKEFVPLDLWVTTVVPKWLCGTFAFHPMLGFRQSRQAGSIAHGCASTLLALGKDAALPNDGAKRASAWGMATKGLPSPEQCQAADPFVRIGEPAEPGNCWYRPQLKCPFSMPAENGGPQETGKALSEVYRLCGRIETHRPQ